MDLVRALADLAELGVAEVALDGELAGVAVAAVDLDGVVAGLHGRLRGDLVPWCEVRFAFDPALREHADLTNVPARRAERAERGHVVEERYRWPSTGVIEVTIKALEDGFEKKFALGRAGRTST